MKTALEVVTPEMAREYLTHNTGNRPLRQTWINGLVGMIQRGQWAETHQGIAFAKSGRLLDGQHRLHAIMAAGRSVRLLVTRELDEDVFVHIDGGRTRSLQDRLKLIGDSEPANTYAVAITRAYLWLAGDKSRVVGATVDTLENTFLRFSDEVSYVAHLFSRRKVVKITVAPVGAAVMIYMRHDKERGTDFCDSLVRGADLPSGSPILALREGLMAGRIAGESEKYWKTINATRYFHRGDDVRSLVAATEDWEGNQYQRLADKLVRNREKGAETRKTGQILRAVGK